MNKLEDVLDIANQVLAKYHIEPITAEDVAWASEKLAPSLDNSSETQQKLSDLWQRIRKQEYTHK